MKLMTLRNKLIWIIRQAMKKRSLSESSFSSFLVRQGFLRNLMSRKKSDK